MLPRFKNKVGIVTGAASGIGEATAKLLLDEGASVVVADLNSPDRLLSQYSDRLSYVHCDVGDEAQVQEVVRHTKDRFGRIDLLVNNAVMFAPGTLASVDSAGWRRSMRTNINSVFYFCSLVIPHMQSSGGGSIVNIGSIVGSAGQYGTVPYGTAKGAIINFTRCVALDHARENIRVNVVCPGVILTPPHIEFGTSNPAMWKKIINSIPMGRGGKASEIAEVVAFFLSDAASFVTGVEFPVDGGQMAHTGLPNYDGAADA